MRIQFFQRPVISRQWSVVLVLIAATLCWAPQSQASAAPDQNWPQWRGPLQNGVAPKANPPTEWSETKNVKWKAKIPGLGSSTPIVWEDKVFVLTAVPTGKKVEPAPSAAGEQEARPQTAGGADEPRPPRGGPGGPGGRGGRGGFGRGEKPTEVHQFVIVCFNRQDGKVLWQQVAREEVPHEGHHRSDGTFASSSPITDGERVYAYFGSRGLHCYDMNGKLQWSQDLGDMKISNSFGEGSSATLYEEALIVNWDHEEDDFIAALDKKTGKTLWKKTRDERTSWATPLVVEHGGKTQVITAASRKVRAYDLATGEIIWECAGLGSNVIPTPVTGHGMVFAMSGHERPKLLAIRLGRSGDLTGTDAVAWSLDKGTAYVASPLLYGNYLLFFSRTSGRLSCFDAQSGRPHYEAEQVEGLQGVYASPVVAGDRVYLVGRNGTTVVIKPGDKLETLATNALEEKIDASPAIAGKDLFLRGRGNLYCIAEK